MYIINIHACSVTLVVACSVASLYTRLHIDMSCILAGQTLIIEVKESGESHAKVVSHDRMLLCQSDLFSL